MGGAGAGLIGNPTVPAIQPSEAHSSVAKQLGGKPIADLSAFASEASPLFTGTLAKQLGGKPIVPSTPLTGEVRQAVYESHPRVVSLQDPNFSNSYLGSYKVRPTIPDNNSDVPAAFSPVNQTYGVNKQWATAPIVAGTTLADRLKTFAAGTLNPNPLKNTLTTPDPRKNVLTNPESAIGNAIGGKVGNIISHLNPLSWWD